MSDLYFRPLYFIFPPELLLSLRTPGYLSPLTGSLPKYLIDYVVSIEVYSKERELVPYLLGGSGSGPRFEGDVGTHTCTLSTWFRNREPLLRSLSVFVLELN